MDLKQQIDSLQNQQLWEELTSYLLCRIIQAPELLFVLLFLTSWSASCSSELFPAFCHCTFSTLTTFTILGVGLFNVFFSVLTLLFTNAVYKSEMHF